MVKTILNKQDVLNILSWGGYVREFRTPNFEDDEEKTLDKIRKLI